MSRRLRSPGRVKRSARADRDIRSKDETKRPKPDRRESGAFAPALCLAPAAEHEAAQGKAEPEGADGEPADRDCLAPGREALPAPERFPLLERQRLPAAPPADRAARPPTQLEGVRELGGP